MFLATVASRETLGMWTSLKNASTAKDCPTERLSAEVAALVSSASALQAAEVGLYDRVNT